jgi:cytochrome P450
LKEAHEQLMAFMRSQVAERKAEIASGSSSIRERERGNDIFTMLVRANEDEGAKFQLGDQELIGNVFIMLIAGHGAYYYNYSLGPRCGSSFVLTEVL